MTRALAVVLVAALAAPARGDESASDPSPLDPATKSQVDDAFARGDYEHARELLVDAYGRNAHPDLLYALGQVELQLKHYKAAIEYYEKFIATNPDPVAAARAQQAIGAARLELARPPPPPPPPPPPKLPKHRQFDALDSALAIGGVVALAGSGVAFYEMVHLSDDRSGTLHDYDRRIAHADIARIVGISASAVGAAVIVAALFRWRLHWFDTAIEVRAPAGGVAISLERPL